MTRWLTDDELQSWLKLAGVMLKLNPALDSQLQRDSDLTHFGYLCLAMLSEKPDRMHTMSSLAGRTNASLSRLSHVITKMEKAGWVRRESIRGSRGSDAVLTDAGMAKVVEAAPPHVESVRALVFDGLSTDQVRQLSELGSAMLTQLDKGIAAGTGRA